MAVYKKNDRWWIDFYYDGIRERFPVSTKKRDAEAALSEIKVAIEAGRYQPRRQGEHGEAMTLDRYLTDEFLPWSEVEHSAGHHRRLRSILNAHLIPAFGSFRLDQITPKMIADYKISRRRSRLVKGNEVRAVNVATVNREICCLKVLFRKACEWGYLDENPTKDVKVSKEVPLAPVLLEQREVAQLLQKMPDHLRALTACAVYAGLRREELFHLRWIDLDEEAGQITVVSRLEHHTKNYETRSIPMNDALKAELRRHPRRPGSPYVFSNRAGKPYDNVRKSLNRAAAEAGIPGNVGLHQLRHAFCSHVLMAGVDPHTVQKWMGHRDLRTTLGYAHVSPRPRKGGNPTAPILAMVTIWSLGSNLQKNRHSPCER